LGAIDGNVC